MIGGPLYAERKEVRPNCRGYRHRFRRLHDCASAGAQLQSSQQRRDDLNAGARHLVDHAGRNSAGQGSKGLRFSPSEKATRSVLAFAEPFSWIDRYPHAMLSPTEELGWTL